MRKIVILAALASAAFASPLAFGTRDGPGWGSDHLIGLAPTTWHDPIMDSLWVHDTNPVAGTTVDFWFDFATAADPDGNPVSIAAGWVTILVDDPGAIVEINGAAILPADCFPMHNGCTGTPGQLDLTLYARAALTNRIDVIMDDSSAIDVYGQIDSGIVAPEPGTATLAVAGFLLFTLSRRTKGA